MSGKNIKIYMCTHKEFPCLPPLAVAVRGGSALYPPVRGAISDVGPNGDISAKNAEYCELTVQYYAYKNEDADYYGFCHYRRFFAFRKQSKRPYLVYGNMPKNSSGILGDEDDIKALCENYDIILPHPEDLGVSAREYYERAPHAHKDDLDLFVAVIAERAPEMLPFMEEYLCGSRQYFCNMFVMKKELFFEYSELLFDILFEFDKRKKLHGSFQSDRTDGYLAERFLGAYVLYSVKRGVRIATVPRVDAYAPLSKRITYHLFPPESKRRFWVKRLLGK